MVLSKEEFFFEFSFTLKVFTLIRVSFTHQ
jgi:hypothetical protein